MPETPKRIGTFAIDVGAIAIIAYAIFILPQQLSKRAEEEHERKIKSLIERREVQQRQPQSTDEPNPTS
jgi:hypothetical protein